MGTFRGGSISQRVFLQRSLWSQFRLGADGESFTKLLQGKIGSALICVCFKHSEVRQGMCRHTIVMTTEAPPGPSPSPKMNPFIHPRVSKILYVNSMDF